MREVAATSRQLALLLVASAPLKMVDKETPIVERHVKNGKRIKPWSRPGIKFYAA